MRWLACISAGLLLTGLAGHATASDEPAPAVHPQPDQPRAATARAETLLQVGDLVIPHETFAIYTRPGASREVEVLQSLPGDTWELIAEHGEVAASSDNRWIWTAPDTPGLYSLVVNDPSRRTVHRINAFVMRPLSQAENGYLNGYRIGQYPDKALRGNPRYNPPNHLVEVTTENQDALISPNFRLRQFLTKQGGDWPRYVRLDERLLLKLEMILDKVREKGWPAETLFIMSGYRTPWYNRNIGNVPYSRHVYGDASDIFVDTDGSGRMDDLNNDGKESFADAVTLASWIDELADDPFSAALIGGLGRYGPKPHRGPFVHVDTRGTAARWDAP